MHTYIERIRNSNERTKKRFIIVASTLSMLVVVSLWVVYLNLTIPSLGGLAAPILSATSSDITSESAPAVNDSFFGVIIRGAKVIGGNITQQFVSLKENAVNEFTKIGGLAAKKNESVVVPSNTKFVPNTSLEPIPSTKLPE